MIKCFVWAVLILSSLSCSLIGPSPPRLNPPPGTYSKSIELTMTSDADGEIYYTTDGSNPIQQGIVYTEPLKLNSKSIIKAVSRNIQGQTSFITTGVYEFEFGAPSFSLNPPSGYYNTGILLNLEPQFPMEIYYTVTSDGSEPEEPDVTGPRYLTPISLPGIPNRDTRYRMKCKSRYSGPGGEIIESEVLSAEWTIDMIPPSLTGQLRIDTPVAAREDTVILTFALSEPGCKPAVNFQDLDSAYTKGSEIIADGGDGNYTLFYTLKKRNTLPANTEITLVLSGTDKGGNPIQSPAGYDRVTLVYTGEHTLSPMPLSSYLNILSNSIKQTSSLLQYSIDGGLTWQDCNSSTVELAPLIGGETFWVREKQLPANKLYLGKVSRTSGRGDLVPGSTLFFGKHSLNQTIHGSPGDRMMAGYHLVNRGDETIARGYLTVRGYISSDRIITSQDTKLFEAYYTEDIPPGKTNTQNIFIPLPNLPPGEYYFGIAVDENNNRLELNELNNITLPGDAVRLVIDEQKTLPPGAFKFINSWGIGDWEHIPDGAYWVTYETMKKQQMVIFYYENSFSHIYTPTLLGVFSIIHPRRDKTHIIFGLGNPSAPFKTKEFHTPIGDYLQNGQKPYPSNAMAFDLSEFAPYINDYDLFITVKNISAYTGRLESFSLEYYTDYNRDPIKILEAAGRYIPAQSTVHSVIATKGVLTGAEVTDIQPLSRDIRPGLTLIQEQPSEPELQRDMAAGGIFDPARTYGNLYKGKYGTGAQPPMEAHWRKMKKLREIETPGSKFILPNGIDLSKTKYFPPIGDQGNKNSCTTYTFSYYIQTYTEAREHDWDLSGAGWEPDPTGLSSSGRPSAHRDKIFSPDFVFHQINDGGNVGAFTNDAASVITKTGGASWQSMPYRTEDFTTWPGETAWREAPLYRGREVNVTGRSYNPGGYFVIYTDDDIQLLKKLLAAGYLVGTNIRAVATEGGSLLQYMDKNDVVHAPTVAKMEIDHSQVIAGYKEGPAWNKESP